MIKKVNTILEKYIFEELGRPNDNEVDFSFNLPSRQWIESITNTENWVNIYLLEIKENLELRQNSWQKQEASADSIIMKKPPIYVDLFYIVTFFSKNKNIQTEHNFLEAILLSLYDFENLASKNNELDQKIINKIKLELFPKPFIDENASYQLWSAINQDARPYIPLKITLPLDSKISLDEKIVKENGKKIILEEKPLKEES